ncbi:MAG: tetratricopeptide repeat protein [Planctomycetota bacterium]
MPRFRFALSASLVLALLAVPSVADRLITKDGRVLTCKKARMEGTGYKLVFEKGELLVPDKTQIASVEIEGDMSDYVPANDDERKKLADGFVRYQGKWLSKAAYEAELKKSFETSKARTADIAKHSDFANAWQKETQHFVVRSNTSPELLDYYCELLETYYALQDQRIGISPTPSFRRAKLAVNVYKSHEDFRKLAPYGGPGGEVPESVLGFFAPRDRPEDCSLNFFHNYEEPAESTWVALHECTHLLTFLIDQQYDPQIWVNEGVADYFGSSKVERDRKGKLVIKPGELQTDRVLTVQQAIAGEGNKTGGGPGKGSGSRDKKLGLEGRPFTKLEQLFFLSRDEFDGFQYAHAWSFVYFLNNFENGKYQKAFDKFFKGLYTLEKGIPFEPAGRGKKVKPEDIRAYLLKKLGVKDTEDLEKQWRNYIAAIAISGPEARLKRGIYLMYGEGDFENALTDLNAAIEGGVKEARAFSARGQCLAFTNEPEKAIEDFKKAVELDPLNGRYHYLLSRSLTGALTLGGFAIDIQKAAGQAASDEAKLHAGLASELEPENDRIREWYERISK